jgi:hypothetical protein
MNRKRSLVVRPMVKIQRLRMVRGYLLRDDFIDTVAAGSVNGTPAVPGPGTRVVEDLDGDAISVGSGALNWANPNGNATDQNVHYGAITRLAGRMLLTQVNMSTQAIFLVGWDQDQIDYATQGVYYFAAGGNFSAYSSPLAGIGTFSASVEYKLCALLRSAGNYYFIKGGAFTYWTLLFVAFTDTASPLYPSFCNNNITTIAIQYVRVPKSLWSPVPLISDGMSIASRTDGLGHSEGVAGGLGSGGGGLAYANLTTWAVAGGIVTNTPVPGAELLTNGNMETADPPSSWTANNATLDGVADERTGGGGAQSLDVLRTASTGSAYQQITGSPGFYKFAGWMKSISGGGCVGGATTPWALINSAAVWTYKTGEILLTSTNPYIYLIAGPNVNDEHRFDDMSVKALSLADCVRAVSSSLTPDIVAQVKFVALTSGYTCAGLAIRLNNAATPTAGIIAFFDYGTVYVYEFSGSTWTLLFSAVKGFTANDRLQIIAQGASIRLIHMTSAGVGTVIGSTAVATILTGGYHGIFTTDPGSQLDDFVVYPRGSGGEYNILDKWAA